MNAATLSNCCVTISWLLLIGHLLAQGQFAQGSHKPSANMFFKILAAKGTLSTRAIFTKIKEYPPTSIALSSLLSNCVSKVDCNFMRSSSVNFFPLASFCSFTRVSNVLSNGPVLLMRRLVLRPCGAAKAIRNAFACFSVAISLISLMYKKLANFSSTWRPVPGWR